MDMVHMIAQDLRENQFSVHASK